MSEVHIPAGATRRCFTPVMFATLSDSSSDIPIAAPVCIALTLWAGTALAIPAKLTPVTVARILFFPLGLRSGWAYSGRRVSASYALSLTPTQQSRAPRIADPESHQNDTRPC